MASKIVGLGMFAPQKKLTNYDLEKMVETNDSWIMERTGIRVRRIAEPGAANSDLALIASQRALADAGVRPEEIDLIVLGTCSPDMVLPSTACFLQMKLGATNAWAMDVVAACSGFLYALGVADAQIRTGRAKKALVIGSEVLSSLIDYTDRSTCILFGDGAGAAVLAECEEGDGILSCNLQSDGNLWELIHVPGPGTVNPISPDLISRKMIYLRMLGNETFKHAVTKMGDVALKTLSDAGYGIDDVALLVPHQANMRIISAIGKRLGLTQDRVFVNLDQYGNTSAASIPLALAEAKAQGRFQPGDLVLLVAFGAGLTWGSTLMRM
ncbi:MAG: 3-oxoacyl-(acyl-carrier-protein) synthase [Deltaproteobacteria bacterium]|nr:3-oxoacyl-(acyl-carrier-protein) synthase [Deltaproteobacteria bacterium]